MLYVFFSLPRPVFGKTVIGDRRGQNRERASRPCLMKMTVYVGLVIVGSIPSTP